MYEWLRKPVHLPSGLELSSADQVSLGSGAPDYVAFLAKFGAKQLGEVNTRNTKVQVTTQGGYSNSLSQVKHALARWATHPDTIPLQKRPSEMIRSGSCYTFLNDPSRRFHNHGEEPTRLTALISAVTFKTQLRHYAK